MVGTGIFTTTGVLLSSLRSPPLVVAVWALAGVLALCGAAVYAELGATIPRAGGEYVYISRAFGPAMGFLSGWIALIVGFAATVLAAFVLRRREPTAERPHRALAWPASGLLFLALSAFMIVLSIRERPFESAAGLVTLVAGAAAYRGWRRAAIKPTNPSR